MRDGIGQARLDAGAVAAVAHRLHQQALQAAVEGHHGQFGRAGEQLLHDGAAQGYAHQRRQLVRVLRIDRMLGQGFDDAAHVADVHALGQQVLQHLLQGRQRQHLRHQVFHQPRRILAQVVEQRLHFRAAQQFGSVRGDQVVQVRGHHGARIDHRVTHRLRLVAQAGVDPGGGQAERGIAGGHARQGAAGHAGIDRQELPIERFAHAHFHALEGDAVGGRVQFQVVADMHGWRQETHFLGKFLADALDALE